MSAPPRAGVRGKEEAGVWGKEEAVAGVAGSATSSTKLNGVYASTSGSDAYRIELGMTGVEQLGLPAALSVGGWRSAQTAAAGRDVAALWLARQRGGDLGHIALNFPLAHYQKQPDVMAWVEQVDFKGLKKWLQQEAAKGEGVDAEGQPSSAQPAAGSEGPAAVAPAAAAQQETAIAEGAGPPDAGAGSRRASESQMVQPAPAPLTAAQREQRRSPPLSAQQPLAAASLPCAGGQGEDGGDGPSSQAPPPTPPAQPAVCGAPAAGAGAAAAAAPEHPAAAFKSIGVKVLPTGRCSVQVNMQLAGSGQPATVLYVGGWGSVEDAAIARDFAVLWYALRQGRDPSQLQLNLPLSYYSQRPGLLQHLRGSSFAQLEAELKQFAEQSMQLAGARRGGAAAGAAGEGAAADLGGSSAARPVAEPAAVAAGQAASGGSGPDAGGGMEGGEGLQQSSAVAAAAQEAQAGGQPASHHSLLPPSAQPAVEAMASPDASGSESEAQQQQEEQQQEEVEQQQQQRRLVGTKRPREPAPSAEEPAGQASRSWRLSDRETSSDSETTHRAPGGRPWGVQRNEAGLFEAFAYRGAHSNKRTSFGAYDSEAQAGAARDLGVLWARQRAGKSLAEGEYRNWNLPDLQLHANRALLRQLSKLERPQEVRDFASQWLEENWGRAARWLGVSE